MPSTNLEIDGFKLGVWIGAQRQQYKKNKLPEERIKLLKKIPGWIWNTYDAEWEMGFEQLKKHGVVKKGYITRDGYKLGSWVINQRARKNRLSEERIEFLESVPGWKWNIYGASWEIGFEQLKKYGVVVGRYVTPDGYNLGGWIEKQRTKKDRLSEEQIELLESVLGWKWRVHDSAWEMGFEQLKKHGVVVRSYVTPDGYNLGGWISHKRAEYSAGKLSKERIELLETIPGWKWKIR